MPAHAEQSAAPWRDAFSSVAAPDANRRGTFTVRLTEAFDGRAYPKAHVVGVHLSCAPIQLLLPARNARRR